MSDNRIAPNAEQAYWLHKIGTGAVAQDEMPPSVFAFLVQQKLVSTRRTIGGEHLVELSAAGCLAALEYLGV